MLDQRTDVAEDWVRAIAELVIGNRPTHIGLLVVPNLSGMSHPSRWLSGRMSVGVQSGPTRVKATHTGRWAVGPRRNGLYFGLCAWWTTAVCPILSDNRKQKYQLLSTSGDVAACQVRVSQM